MAETEQKIRQLSAKQKQILVDFVYARPEMQKGKLTPTYTKMVANALWEQVTATLNAIPGGSIKTSSQWNKTWRDLRKNVKNRASKQVKYAKGTGGGPPMPPPPLTLPESNKTIDEKIMEILTPVSVQGNVEVPDPFLITEDIIRETANDDDRSSEDIDCFNIHHDYASSTGFQNKAKQIQFDDLHTEPEVTVIQTNTENIKLKENLTFQKKGTQNLQD